MSRTSQSDGSASNPPPIGSVKFVLLHHDGCKRESFHYRIGLDGTVCQLLSTNTRSQHPNSLGIVVTGSFDDSAPSQEQMEALKQLLVKLKLQFPDFVLGAHRQVRGDSITTCPGRKFPMKELASWAIKDLIEIRNERIRVDIESQYGP